MEARSQEIVAEVRKPTGESTQVLEISVGGLDRAGGSTEVEVRDDLELPLRQELPSCASSESPLGAPALIERRRFFAIFPCCRQTPRRHR